MSFRESIKRTANRSKVPTSSTRRFAPKSAGPQRRGPTVEPSSSPVGVDSADSEHHPIYRLPVKKVLLYADRGLVVLNKPNGLISQLLESPTQNAEPGVQNDVLSTLLTDLREELDIKQPLRTVHRLDRPTTGALALACSKESAKEFSRQISNGQAQKTYLALVCGGASAFKEKSGLIETELQCENGWVRIPGIGNVYERDHGVVRNSPTRGESWTKNAISEYEVLDSSHKAPVSLLRLRLHTGHKHQLRVHLAQHLRTPILGDHLFCDVRSPVFKSIKQAIGPVPSSMFLHSSRFSLERYCPSRFRLTIGAPLTSRFIDLCRKVGIELDGDDVAGGVWVDGTKVLGTDANLPAAEALEPVLKLGGKWYWPSG